MLDIKEDLSRNLISRFYIGGEWIPNHSAQRTTVIDPSTEDALADLPLADRSDVERAIAAARAAFDQGPWPLMTGPERSVYLKRFVALLEKRFELLTRLSTAQVECRSLWPQTSSGQASHATHTMPTLPAASLSRTGGRRPGAMLAFAASRSASPP